MTLPADTVWVVLPKAMTFTGGNGAGFESSPRIQRYRHFWRATSLPVRRLSFRSQAQVPSPATTRMDRAASLATAAARRLGLQGTSQAAADRQAHQYSRSAVEIQMVDSRRTGGVTRGCGGISAAEAGRGGRGCGHNGGVRDSIGSFCSENSGHFAGKKPAIRFAAFRRWSCWHAKGS